VHAHSERKREIPDSKLVTFLPQKKKKSLKASSAHVFTWMIAHGVVPEDGSQLLDT